MWTKVLPVVLMLCPLCCHLLHHQQSWMFFMLTVVMLCFWRNIEATPKNREAEGCSDQQQALAHKWMMAVAVWRVDIQTTNIWAEKEVLTMVAFLVLSLRGQLHPPDHVQWVLQRHSHHRWRKDHWRFVLNVKRTHPTITIANVMRLSVVCVVVLRNKVWKEVGCVDLVSTNAAHKSKKQSVILNTSSLMTIMPTKTELFERSY